MHVQLTPIFVYTQACTAYTYIRVFTGMNSSHSYTAYVYTVHRHVQLTPINLYNIHRHVQLTPIFVYTQACTAHTYIRVFTGMYSSHLYSCIHRHVQLTPIFVYTQACTAHTYICVFTGIYRSHSYTAYVYTQACTLYRSHP